jgi:hypothetical protein
MFNHLLDINTLEKIEKSSFKQNNQKKKVSFIIPEEEMKNLKELTIEKNNNQSPFSSTSILNEELKNLNINTSNSFSKELNKEIISENKKEEKKKLNDLYSNLENNKLYNQYGNEFFKYEKIMDKKNRIHSTFIKKNNISTDIRFRMVDWMIEVFSCIYSESYTFFRAVDLMDRYLEKSKKEISNNDIYLIGLTCIYISLKEEDIYPLRLCYIQKNIGHNKFTSHEILKVEKDILEDINFEILNISTFDFVLELFSHFIINNKNKITQLNLSKYIDSLKNISYFLCKLSCVLYKFTTYLASLKAISIIICSFTILQSKSETFDDEKQKFIKHWILDLINECKFNLKTINNAYEYLASSYDYIMNSEEGKNTQLYKTHTFYFY